MSSSEDFHSESAIKLLDIVYDLYGADKHYPYENIPFSSDEDGAITLSPRLIAALNINKDQDLISWAHDNIAKLFK